MIVLRRRDFDRLVAWLREPAAEPTDEAVRLMKASRAAIKRKP